MSDVTTLELSAYSREALAGVVRKCGFNRSMEIRRQMQIELASGSQKGSSAARMPDYVQKAIIKRITWIEKWCRLYFVYHRTKELNREYPNTDMRSRKRKANQEWEGICKRLSY